MDRKPNSQPNSLDLSLYLLGNVFCASDEIVLAGSISMTGAGAEVPGRHKGAWIEERRPRCHDPSVVVG